jgi:hypothetical protein
VSAPRRFAVIAGLVSWVYSWYLFRGIRTEYAAGVLGPMPRWMLILFALTTTLLVASMIGAGMRLHFWPLLTIGGSLGFVIAVVGAHYGLMSSVIDVLGRGGPHPSLGVVIGETLRSRKTFEVVLISAIPTVLFLAGLSGLIVPRLSGAPAVVAE